jgi:hypothetical protein
MMMAGQGRGDTVGRSAGAGASGLPAGGPSEDELQAMLLQMRDAPVEQVLAEVINVLFQTIQVKLGLPDARTLIDVVAALADTTSGRIDPALHGQVSQALTQLRLAQVEEEQRQGTPPPPAAPSGPTRGTGQSAAQATDGGSGPSRLWVPGH